MTKLSRVLLISLTLCALIFADSFVAVAQGTSAGDRRFFPETSCYVGGEFLAFYDRYGGRQFLGLPRTNQLSQDGLTVQYFQRARMELCPQNPQPYRVQLSLLGDLLGYRAPPIPSSSIPPTTDPQRRYYPQTGHSLSYVFLQYFDSHGGLDVFGYPITELFMESGRIVQYFQRAKMLWYPEYVAPNQIALDNLGDEYLRRHPPSLGASVMPTNPTAVPVPTRMPTARPPVYATPAGRAYATAVPPAYATLAPPIRGPTSPAPLVADLKVTASVRYPITGQGGSQTVHARVTDGQGRGVGGIMVEFVAHFTTGAQTFRSDSTDASGCTAVTFSIGYPQAGYTVIVEARVNHNGRTFVASPPAKFIPWW